MSGPQVGAHRLPKAAGAQPSGWMRDEKLHAVVARSTLPSQKCQKRRSLGALLEVVMLKKCTPLWCEAHFEVKSVKNVKKKDAPGPRLKVRTWLCAANAKDCKDACSVAGAIQDMFIRDVWRSARWFTESGRVLEHQIFRFAKVILRDRCWPHFFVAGTIH